MPTPFDQLKAALNADSGFAWSWHCNIAMPIMDRLGCSHREANEAAAAVMQHLFGLDMRLNRCWDATFSPRTSQKGED